MKDCPQIPLTCTVEWGSFTCFCRLQGAAGSGMWYAVMAVVEAHAFSELMAALRNLQILQASLQGSYSRQRPRYCECFATASQRLTTSTGSGRTEDCIPEPESEVDTSPSCTCAAAGSKWASRLLTPQRRRAHRSMATRETGRPRGLHTRTTT